ncbi:Type I Iterative PKS [Marasmius oreades]|uniref:Type I Iterative PKS n=1 Tax=Marasmius oreades TaxID=181124 RepID=A0A9P7UJW6_9AGAR|nr:Type I Iterative PKS [Marasmius oreades]KAG7085922.1 Type I Iterative PKS [Marasmius oreades]
MASVPLSKSRPSYTNPNPNAMSIVGMSISAPGGVDDGLDTAEFYEFLKARGSGIIVVPKDRWNAEAYHGSQPGKILTTKGGYIPNFTVGDPQEFGITPAEAAQMSCTQLSTLHQAFNALQRSGVDFRGTNTGVYVGCAGGGPPFDFDITEAGAYYMTGTSLAISANRISYVFDMTGPSLPVDTACSSSLTAMHLAVQAIRNGECDQAVVAGVNIIMSPLETSSFSQLSVLSPDGISKSFDEDANGYARGDVVGAVVIKRHDFAVRDHDRVLATLVGSALTSCGSLMGSLTTPSPDAQTQAIKNAYADAGLVPSQADFIELHGTGTIVGDQIEANAAGACFSEGREGREIVIGSVKSNVGHGEMGAYISSIVKVVMMLEQKQILPNGYFKKPSSRINFEKFNLRVPLAVEDFVPHDRNQGLIASISSFGFGGSCGHTVLREHEARPILPDYHSLNSAPYLFAIGGLTPRSVNSLVESYKAEYTKVDPGSLSEHLGSRARQMSWRSFAVADSLAEAKFTEPVMVNKRAVPLVFCFSGQGPQHWQQGRDLFMKYSVFRESILASDKVHTEYTGKSFLANSGLFLPDPPKDSILAKSLTWPADAISISIAFFQIALYDLLVHLGLKPDVIVGHSIGETAVLYASGAMPRDMVIKIAIARGGALCVVDNIGGAMVALSGCDSATVQDYIDTIIAISDNPKAGVTDTLHIAARNSPTDFGVSGAEYLVDELTKYIDTWISGVLARKLRVGTAVHSPYVNACEAQYRQELYRIFASYPGAHRPKIPVMSTVTAEFVTTEYTVDYLWNNLRQPVRFCDAIPKIMEKYGESTVFLEIAPHPVLSSYIKQMGAVESVPGSKRPPSARHIKPGSRPPTELDTLYDSLGNLLVCGVNSVNFALLNGCPPEKIQEPKYPFQPKYFPIGHRVPSYLHKLLPAERPLNSERLRVSPRLPEDWMADHVIDQSNLIPAAAYIEMALEFPDVTSVWDCRFESAFILDGNVPASTLKVSQDGNKWSVRSSSSLQSMQGDLTWTRSEPEFDNLHAYGKLGYGKPEISPGGITHIDVDAVIARCKTTVGHDAVYEELEGVAQFGTEFRRIQKISVNENEAIVRIKGHGETLTRIGYAFHPALMDAVFQSGISWNLLYDHVNVGNVERTFMLPHSLARGFRNDGSTDPLVFPDEFNVYAVLAYWSPSSWTLDCYVLNDNNDVVFTFEGLHFELVQQDHPKVSERFSMIWQPRALPQSRIRGHVTLDDDQTAEIQELLDSLDKLALGYTARALSRLPPDFSTPLPDRKRYMAWALERTSGLSTTLSKKMEDVSTVLKEKYPSLFELTQRVGERQTDIFVNSKAAVDILFRDDLMSRIYEHPPFIGNVFDETVKEFVKLVKSAIDAGKRVVRVLEVGAGTGRFTSLLGHALLDAKLEHCYVDYVCSDISISLAQEATAKSPWNTIVPVAFDLNKPLEEQNVDPASFDIIVAFDVLHATPNIIGTLTILRELLLPGGHLAIIELDGNSFASGAVGSIWMDFIFGSFQEWFGVLEHRDALHCSLSKTEWNRTLRSSGFSDSLFLTTRGVTVSHMSFFSQTTQTALKNTSGQSTPLLENDCSSSPLRSLSLSSLTTPSSAASYLVDQRPPATVSVHDRYSLLKRLGIPALFSPSKQKPSTPVLSAIVQEDLRRSSPSLCHALPPNTIIRRFLAGDEVRLVKYVSTLDSTVPLKVWLYTNTETINATLLGLGRSLRHEFGLWKIYIILFPTSWNSSTQEDYIRNQLIPLQWVDAEVMVDQEGNMRVPRVVAGPGGPETEFASAKPLHFNDTDFWRAFPRPLDAEDVQVSVSFIALSSVIPGHSEFSGKVEAIGANVKKSLIGMRVMGVTPGPNGNYVVCPQGCISVVPDRMSLPFAAALAGRLAFTSSVVVESLAHAKIGARVILHAGDCSPAAMATFAYLQERNFDTFVTVSDPASHHIPHKNVLGSSNVQVWSHAVRRWSSEGADFIFNFGNDPIVLEESVERLARRGTLIQIGDKYPSRIHSGQRFKSVGFDRLFSGEENILEHALQTISRQTMTRISPSSLIFQVDALKLAHSKAADYKDMSILLDFETLPQGMTVYKPGRLRGTNAFDPRASYVVIGGVGGLGVNIARCLVEGGARHVVLTSRSGDKAFANGGLAKEKRIIKFLREQTGVTIDVVAVDCLDEAKTKTLFSTLPNIAGIFYVAVRLNDALFLNLTTEEDWKKVYDVKIKGLRVLLDAVDPKKLDFLVLTSSMATVSGSPGQVNYAAAQTEMEAMGAKIPNCISVTVPPLTDGGVFVRSIPTGNARSAALDKYKDLGMTAIKCAMHCIDAIWTIGTPAYQPVYIPKTNWKKIMEIAVPDYHQAAMRHLLVKENSDALASNGKVEQTILGACASVLSLEIDRVEDNIPLSTYGLDSLTSVRLSGILKTYFSVEVTQLQLLSQTMTVARLYQLQEEQKAAAVNNPAKAESTSDQEQTTNVHEADLDQTIVRLNNVTEGKPLFLMHGAGGGVVVLVKAAQKAHYPVYGVQDTPEAPITGTLRQLSEFYLRKIREKQPDGPYRLGGFSFGTCLALDIAEMLTAQGEVVEALVLLDGSPTLFKKPSFQAHALNGIHDGSIRNDIIGIVNDMVSSGTLDNSDDLGMQFEDHFERAKEGGNGPKWITRFCTAYVSHILMGCRRGKEFLQAEAKAGGRLTVAWPAKRTVLVRALDGVSAQPYAAGSSAYFDLDLYVIGVEKYDLPGTHFGILSPKSGLDAILDRLF